MGRHVSRHFYLHGACMSNDAYIPDYGDDRELQLNYEEFELQQEQDYQEYLEVLARGEENERT